MLHPRWPVAVAVALFTCVVAAQEPKLKYPETKKVEQMQASANCDSDLKAMPVTVARNLTTWMNVALGQQ